MKRDLLKRPTKEAYKENCIFEPVSLIRFAFPMLLECMSKETFIYENMSKETFIYENRPIKETFKGDLFFLASLFLSFASPFRCC